VDVVLRPRRQDEVAGGRPRRRRDPLDGDVEVVDPRAVPVLDRAAGEAGADVVFAPGLTRIEDIRRVVAETGRPVNVLGLPGVPPVAELAVAGVARVSVGGGFAFAAIDALGEAARELRDEGTFGYFTRTRAGAALAREAFKG
jgi:2-methylisocitrate lyase-like PEP mutase family enzyme